MRGEVYMNGWEKFFGEKSDSQAPYDSAFTISNLGFLDLTPLSIPIPPSTKATTEGEIVEREMGERWKVENVTWAQSHTPQGEAFGLDIVGFSGGEGKGECLSLAISCRPDAFADRELHKRFQGYLRRLVVGFAREGEGESGKASQESNGGGSEGLKLGGDPSFASLAAWLVQTERESL